MGLEVCEMEAALGGSSLALAPSQAEISPLYSDHLAQLIY